MYVLGWGDRAGEVEMALQKSQDIGPTGIVLGQDPVVHPGIVWREALVPIY